MILILLRKFISGPTQTTAIKLDRRRYHHVAGKVTSYSDEYFDSCHGNLHPITILGR